MCTCVSCSLWICVCVSVCVCFCVWVRVWIPVHSRLIFYLNGGGAFSGAVKEVIYLVLNEKIPAVNIMEWGISWDTLTPVATFFTVCVCVYEFVSKMYRFNGCLHILLLLLLLLKSSPSRQHSKVLCRWGARRRVKTGNDREVGVKEWRKSGRF